MSCRKTSAAHGPSAALLLRVEPIHPTVDVFTPRLRSAFFTDLKDLLSIVPPLCQERLLGQFFVS